LIHEGDELLAIDGESTSDLSVSEVAAPAQIELPQLQGHSSSGFISQSTPRRVESAMPMRSRQAERRLRGAAGTLVRLRVRRGGVHIYGACLERRHADPPPAAARMARGARRCEVEDEEGERRCGSALTVPLMRACARQGNR
jgi:hypothetical protein